jgi:HEAT repeat protein
MHGYCVSALGYWKGQGSVRVLSGVITEPSTSPLVQKYAAMALNSIADASAGPALTKSLQTMSDTEAASQVAEALGRIRYGLAAPHLLSRMEREPNPAYQVHYARALASLRYTPAIPAIERLCKTTKLSGSWILLKQQDAYLGWVFEIALMRLLIST